MAESVVQTLLGGREVTTVLVGPVVDEEFVVVSGNATDFLSAGLNVESVDADDARASLIGELFSMRPPLVIHVFDNEKEMAWWCVFLWPGEKSEAMMRSFQ